MLLSPDFDSTLCSNSTCNKSQIRLLKGMNKSTLICNKISKLLKRYLSFKLPIGTQLVKSLCKRYVAGEDRGGGSNRGGWGTRGRSRKSGRVGGINK